MKLKEQSLSGDMQSQMSVKWLHQQAALRLLFLFDISPALRNQISGSGPHVHLGID